MGSWKLGYPSGLDGVATEDLGRDLYDSYSVLPITLSTTNICRAVGQVNGAPSYVSDTTITCNNIHVYPSTDDVAFPGNTTFATDEFNNGFIRFLSGEAAGYVNGGTENKVFKVKDTTSNTLIFEDDITAEGITDDDYFEVITGASTYTFPSDRNPIRRDFKRMVLLGKGSLRMPIYDKGLLMPEGYEQDDFVVMANLTSQKEVDRLQVMLSHLLNYKGFDYTYSHKLGIEWGAAPMILETGENTVRNQYLVAVSDWKVVKDAKRSDDFWEVMMHFVSYWKSTHRGI